MKKLLISLFIIGIGFTFMACNEDVTNAVTTLLGTTVETTVGEEVELASTDQVFTLEALSAASLLDVSSVSALNFVPLTEVTTVETVDDEVIGTEEIDQVDKYLELIETFLGDNNGLSVSVLESDREGFDNLISFTSVDVLGNVIVYFMYYNETVFVSEVVDDGTTTTEVPTTEVPTTEIPTTEIPTTEVPTTEAPTTEPVTTEETSDLAVTLGGPDQERNFYFEDDDDNEVVYLLTGVIVANGLEYSVEGKKIVEDNGDEVLRLRSFIDKDNFVKVAYMLDAEDSKQKFFFEVVTDGIVVSNSKVRIFEEEGKTRVMLDLEQNGDSARYNFGIIEEEDVTYIHVRYDIELADGTKESGGIHIVATIDPVTGELIYTYKLIGPDQNKNQNIYTKEFEKRHGKPGDHTKPDNSNGNGKI